MPNTLVELRTYDSFLDRTQSKMNNIRVIGSISAPVGLCHIVGEELEQLFVSASARGTGAALTLIKDAQLNLKNSGVNKAWLACALGNSRAERFYKKCGWAKTGKMLEDCETTEGVFKLEVWRFEKSL